MLITTLGSLTTMTILLLAIIRNTIVSLVSFVDGESCKSYHPNFKSWVSPWVVGFGMQDFEFVASNGTVLHTLQMAQKWTFRDMRRRRL